MSLSIGPAQAVQQAVASLQTSVQSQQAALSLTQQVIANGQEFLAANGVPGASVDIQV